MFVRVLLQHNVIFTAHVAQVFIHLAHAVGHTSACVRNVAGSCMKPS